MLLTNSRQLFIEKASLVSPHLLKVTIGALLVLLIMPLWVVTYLPFGDIPDHASQINSILNLDRLEDEYKVNWFTPYLFTYCLTIALSQIFGVVYAIKVILSISLVAFPFITYKIVKVLDGDEKWAIPSIVAYEKRAPESDPENLFSKRNLFLVLTIGVVFLVLNNHLKTISAYKQDDQDFKKILSKMEENKRVMSLIYDNAPHLPFTPAFQHYGKWYAAVKPGQVNYSFSIDPSMWHFTPLRYLGPDRPILHPWKPQTFSWRRHKGEIYDYFLVRNSERMDHLFVRSRNQVVFIAQEGKWQLYGKKIYLEQQTTTE